MNTITIKKIIMQQIKCYILGLSQKKSRVSYASDFISLISISGTKKKLSLHFIYRFARSN